MENKLGTFVMYVLIKLDGTLYLALVAHGAAVVIAPS